MRSTLVLAATLAVLPAPAALADDYDDCKAKCAGDRDTRNADCPTSYDSSERVREQCLKDSQDAYLACVHSCPPPSSSQRGPATMTFEFGHTPVPGADGRQRDANPATGRSPAPEAARRAQTPDVSLARQTAIGG